MLTLKEILGVLEFEAACGSGRECCTVQDRQASHGVGEFSQLPKSKPETIPEAETDATTKKEEP